VSKTQRDIITRELPYLDAKIKVIYNPLPEISHIDIEGDDFGYFGGPNFLKGFHTLCQALMHTSNINSKLPSIHATKFQSINEKLAETLRKLGFLLYGKLDNYEYEKLYKRVRAVIVPSIWNEPWGYVVVEALTRGRFLVTSSSGSIPEQVKGCNGVILCEPGNSKELAEAIQFVSGLDREEIIDFGFQNKEIYLKKFSDESTLRRFTSVCENLT